jgi:uncharacterized protein YjlB
MVNALWKIEQMSNEWLIGAVPHNSPAQSEPRALPLVRTRLDLYREVSMIVEHFTLESGPIIPNNAELPVIVYRQAISTDGDLATAFESAFARNDWQGTWRNGIYDYHHYHSGAHKVLGIARGSGHVMLGGPGGLEFTVATGDCLLLPAGTGHCRISASPDFLVIGAYPPGQHADMQTRAPDAETAKAIRDCPLPEKDPVDGAEEALKRLWHKAP